MKSRTTLYLLVLGISALFFYLYPLDSTAQPPRRDHGFSIVLPDVPVGDNYLKVTVTADGKASAIPLSVASMAPLPTPGPGPIPPSPTELTARAKEIKALAEAVTGDPNRDQTAKGLAALYREIAKTARTGQVSDRNVLFSMVKMGTDLFLNKNPGNWTPVRDKLAVQWSQIPLTVSNPVTSSADLLDEAASGLDASAPNKAIDPAVWQLILKIIEIILQLLNK